MAENCSMAASTSCYGRLFQPIGKLLVLRFGMGAGGVFLKEGDNFVWLHSCVSNWKTIQRQKNTPVNIFFFTLFSDSRKKDS